MSIEGTTRIRVSLKVYIRYTSVMIALSMMIVGCNEDGLTGSNNNFEFSERLSRYEIFNGEMSALQPAADFLPYELTTELFSDYALKQRLIRVPAGKTLVEKGEGLPEFPDSTVMVKTFYYLNDARDAQKGKRILETRLLLKHRGKWNVATYVWNDEQTEATLVTSGLNTTVNWIDEGGNARVLSYHVPSTRECATCHNGRGTTVPIGPKARNLDRKVHVAGDEVNQLDYWVDKEILVRSGAATMPLPAWNDASQSLEDRARAYLDVNCAHCHNQDGFASTRLNLSFEETKNGGAMRSRRKSIVELMRRGRMPMIGTTVVHQEGVELIQSYVDSLK